MNNVYKSASDAMTAAYELSRATGRRVWRHAVDNKWGVGHWVVSFISTPPAASQELTA